MHVIEYDLDWEGLIATPYHQLAKVDRLLVATRQVYPKGLYREDVWRYAWNVDPATPFTPQDEAKFYSTLNNANTRRLSGTNWRMRGEAEIVFLQRQFSGSTILPPSDKKLLDQNTAPPSTVEVTIPDEPRIVIQPEHRPYLVKMLRMFTDLMVQGLLATMDDDPVKVLEGILPEGLSAGEIVGDIHGEPENRILTRTLQQELGDILEKPGSNNVNELSIINHATRLNPKNPKSILSSVKQKFDPPPKAEKPPVLEELVMEELSQEPTPTDIATLAPVVEVQEVARVEEQQVYRTFYERLFNQDPNTLSPTQRLAYFVFNAQAAVDPNIAMNFMREGATTQDLLRAGAIINSAGEEDNLVLCHSSEGLGIVPTEESLSEKYIRLDDPTYFPPERLHLKPVENQTKAEKFVLLVKQSRVPITRNGALVKLNVRSDLFDELVAEANDYLSDHGRTLQETKRGFEYERIVESIGLPSEEIYAA